jgi:hypothetical protein
MSPSPCPLRVPRRSTGTKVQLPNAEVASRLGGRLASVAAAAGITLRPRPQTIPSEEDEPTNRCSVRKHCGQQLRRAKSFGHNSASAKECRATELSRPARGKAESLAQQSMPLRTTSLGSQTVQAVTDKVSHAHRKPRAPPRNSLPPQQPKSGAKTDRDKNVCQVRKHRAPPPRNTLPPRSESYHQRLSCSDHGDASLSNHLKRGSLTSPPPRSKSADSTSSSDKGKEPVAFFDWAAYAAGSCGCGKGPGKHSH